MRRLNVESIYCIIPRRPSPLRRKTTTALSELPKSASPLWRFCVYLHNLKLDYNHFFVSPVERSSLIITLSKFFRGLAGAFVQVLQQTPRLP